MKLKFSNKRITGILTVLPENEVSFDQEVENYNFSRSQSMKLKLIMGYNKRRVASEGTTSSDLCVYGLNYLLEKGLLKKDDVDALILVTQSPDYFMPPTSTVIHGRVGFKKDIFCLDINQGCSGYIMGLIQAFMLLDQQEINKVVLLNSDVLSSKVSTEDRNSRPIIGDAASVTIIEKDEVESNTFCQVKFDGSGCNALIIPAGGFKTPSSAQTAVLEKDSAGNSRALDHLRMKGDDVFNFVQREVPDMIENLLKDSNLGKESIDYYLFHQPNKFMLKKLADKLEIPYKKMPNNIVEKFGNSSGPTIPVVITDNLSDVLLNQSLLVCMAGFGTGLSWGSIIMELGKLKFCENIEYN